MKRDIASLAIEDQRADTVGYQLIRFAAAVQTAERLGHPVEVRAIRNGREHIVSLVASADEVES